MGERSWREINFFLLGCVAVLLIMSMLSVYSATLNAMSYGIPLDTLFPRHIQNIVIGVIAMVVITTMDYRVIAGLAFPFYVGTIGLLAVVLVLGEITSGAQSWVMLGTRTFQPAEFSKLAVIVALSAYWAHFESQSDRWLVVAGSLVIAGIPLLLVMAQPDLGTALIFAAIWLVMAWGVGVRWHHLVVLFLMAIPLVLVVWLQILNVEQRSRLMTFYWLLMNPAEVDPNEGYNVIQSLTAISSGGLLGTGLTRGLLSQGNYIPVQYSDFIFAVVGEEMGFIGGAILLTLQALFLWLTLSIAERARDTLGRMIAIGIFAMILVHVVVNIGVTMSILPVTGIPLPFISYGGSFTITMLIAVGLLESVAIRWRKIVF